eukprot:scaffold23069_cov36-Tisochrysis_lutea.AAC.2
MDRYKLDVATCGKNFTKVRKAITSGYFTHAAKKDPQEGYKTMDEGQVSLAARHGTAHPHVYVARCISTSGIIPVELDIDSAFTCADVGGLHSPFLGPIQSQPRMGHLPRACAHVERVHERSNGDRSKMVD